MIQKSRSHVTKYPSLHHRGESGGIAPAGMKSNFVADFRHHKENIVIKREYVTRIVKDSVS